MIKPMPNTDTVWLPLNQALHRALYDPATGYYSHKNPLGRSGDFITAPEISQVFGEMLGLWCIEMWQRAGCPTPVRLLELGPGRGVMMADVLRILKLVPVLMEAVTCHLIEVSSPLRKIQAQTLASHEERLFWHDDLDVANDQIPNGFTLILANEFFDALPISQFILREDGWKELGIAYDGDNVEVQERSCVSPFLRFDADRDCIIELCPLDSIYVKKMSDRLRVNGGAALIIDYGEDVPKWQGETLQALLHHKKVSVWDHLGNADISHHVDFHGLRDAFRQEGIVSSDTRSQGEFLRALGIEQRADQLAQKMDPVKRAAQLTATHRLISSAEMGNLFKVLEVCFLPQTS